MFRRLVLSTLLFTSLTSVAHAGSTTGVIRTIYVNLLANQVYVQFEGAPIMDTPGCSSYWATGSLDDGKLMKFVYPLLISAKASAAPVSLGYVGCIGVYPQIVSVDYEPRLIN